MPIPKKYLADLTEEKIYHIYNRTNNRELLFRSDENRRYFLNKYDQYLSPFLNTFCWNLIPNHFHFLVRIKSSEEIREYLNGQPFKELKPVERKYLKGDDIAERLLETEWQRFFTCYSMSLNKMYSRSGNLFHRPFKRVLVNRDHQFTQAVIYIHANSVKHRLINDFTAYPWSS
jgi:putative transposase